MHENCCKITKKVSDIAINTANKGLFSASISFFLFFCLFCERNALYLSAYLYHADNIITK